MSSVAVPPREEALTSPSFEPAFDDVDGLLAKKRMGTKSGLTGIQVNWRLSAHVYANGLGTVLPSEVAFQFAGLAGGRPRFADVAFVTIERYPGGEVPDGWTDFAPDFVVEVVSPHDNATSLELKVQGWLDVAFDWCGSSILLRSRSRPPAGRDQLRCGIRRDAFRRGRGSRFRTCNIGYLHGRVTSCSTAPSERRSPIRRSGCSPHRRRGLSPTSIRVRAQTPVPGGAAKGLY